MAMIGIWTHPLIRSEEACLESTKKAIELAILHDARLHVAHVTTAAELEMFAPFTSRITAEATVGHLYFSLVDYDRLGSQIKVNPAIKNFRDCCAAARAHRRPCFRHRNRPCSSFAGRKAGWGSQGRFRYADDSVLIGHDAGTG